MSPYPGIPPSVVGVRALAPASITARDSVGTLITVAMTVAAQVACSAEPISGIHAAAVVADVDLEQDIDSHTDRVERPGDRLCALQRVDDRRHLRPSGQPEQTVDLCRADHLDGDQDVRKPGVHHDFGL